jgi:hypothetical protein
MPHQKPVNHRKIAASSEVDFTVVTTILIISNPVRENVMIYVYKDSPALITSEPNTHRLSPLDSFNMSLDSEIQLQFLVGVLRAGLNPWWATPVRRTTAGKQEIRKAISEIYAEAEAEGSKPPNVNQAYRRVAERVAPKHAPKTKIMTELEGFADRRLKRGIRFGSK